MIDLLDYGRMGRTLAVPDIIDMHAHFGNWSWHIPDTTPAGLVAVMDRVGVRSMICSHVQCMGAHCSRGNREVLAAMRAFPGRILGYLVVWPLSEDSVKDEVARCLDAGFVGAKLHDLSGFAYTHRSYTPVYEAAHERRLPVLFHTFGQDHQFAQVGEIAKRYPDATILVAHLRTMNEPGYHRIAREHPNVFVDTVGSSAPRGLVERAVAAIGADKIVWGSDAYCYGLPQQIGKVLGAKISDEDKVKILSGNARRILARRAR
jgi:predicted TIM-barrel fold metal-dependent hydrolase